jgi:hypothetical protein
MRWGKDQEERAACTRKAQDAYAQARQAMEKAAGAEAAADAMLARAEEMMAEIAALRGRVATLECAVDDATMPRRTKSPTPTRKAA